MPKIIECIPNFSEGRNPATIQALIAAVESVPGVRLLVRLMDAVTDCTVALLRLEELEDLLQPRHPGPFELVVVGTELDVLQMAVQLL